MGVFVMVSWRGRGGCADIGKFLHRGGSGGAHLWVRVVVHVPKYWEGAERISPSSDATHDGAGATAEWGRYLDIPSPGGVDGGGVNSGVGDLHLPPPEHCRSIYCDKADYGHVTGGGEVSRGAGYKRW